jgi:2-polyprenyl-3-methyl-5-hydroxy-6-metoxy-1,4-benzoquinol methylase
MIDRSCDLCGASKHTPIVVENGYPIVRCSSCGFVYVNQIPEVEDGKVVGEYYAGTLEEIEAGRARYESVSEFLLREIGRYSTPGSLLDVGCGYGFFLEAARNAGWDVFGTDLSEIAVAHAKETLGLNQVICADLSPNLFDGRRFDAINLTNVLEHVPSPSRTLEACYRLLSDGGILTIRVPNMNFARLRHRTLPILKAIKLGKGGELSYLSSEPPIHLSGFTPDTLTKYFDKTGFATLAIKPSKLSGLANEKSQYRVFEAIVSALYIHTGRRLNLTPTILAIARYDHGATG